VLYPSFKKIVNGYYYFLLSIDSKLPRLITLVQQKSSLENVFDEI
jgi:hypothetical protein